MFVLGVIEILVLTVNATLNTAIARTIDATGPNSGTDALKRLVFRVSQQSMNKIIVVSSTHLYSWFYLHL